MEPATVTVQLQPADLQRFLRFAGGGCGMNWRGLILFAIAVFLIGGSFLLRSQTPDREARNEETGIGEEKPGSALRIFPAVLPVVLFLGILGFFYWRATRPSAYEAVSPGIFQPTTYEVLDRGFLCRSERGEALNYWQAIAHFAETDQDFFVMLAARSGHALPKRCFSTLEAAAIFANQVRIHLEKYAPAALASR